MTDFNVVIDTSVLEKRLDKLERQQSTAGARSQGGETEVCSCLAGGVA